jgi:DNA-binding response OmpR family regulator
MDLRLPDMSGVDTMIAIRREFPEARIVMLTTFEGDVEIKRALEAGARGYILKSMPPKDLVEVIRQVHLGKKRIPSQLAAQLAEHMSAESPEEIGIATSLINSLFQKKPLRFTSNTSWRSWAQVTARKRSRSEYDVASSSFSSVDRQNSYSKSGIERYRHIGFRWVARPV